MYEHFRSVPVKYIDWFISSCVAAIILFTVRGMLKGGAAVSSPVRRPADAQVLHTAGLLFGPPFFV